jgi:hypothetical protein
MRILGPIVPPPAALMQVFDAEIAGRWAYDRKSSVSNRSGAKAYFFRSLRISFRAACLLRLD